LLKSAELTLVIPDQIQADAIQVVEHGFFCSVVVPLEDGKPLIISLALYCS